MDYALLGFVSTLLIPFLAFLFRKRILKALGRLLLTGSIEFVQGYLWDEVIAEAEDGTKMKQRALSAKARAQLEAIAPVLLQATLKSIKLKAPANLPINPVTGKLDFMAPVLMKVASGKKVGVEDFLPLIMEKVMPFAEGFLDGLGGKKKGETPSEPITLGRVTR